MNWGWKQEVAFWAFLVIMVFTIVFLVWFLGNLMMDLLIHAPIPDFKNVTSLLECGT